MGPTYSGLTLDQAIAQYVPPKENNTADYQSYIDNSLSLPGTTALSALSSTQFQNWSALSNLKKDISLQISVRQQVYKGCLICA
jgi:hypothetical protein